MISAAFGFFTTPVGRAVMLALAFLIWTAYQRDQAADRARTECRAEQMQKTIDEIARQRDAAERALAEAEKRVTETQAEMAELEKRRAETIAQSDRSCRIDSATRKRLRDIQ